MIMKKDNFKDTLFNALKSMLGLGFLILVAASCSDTILNGTGNGTASVNFLLTDAPGDYQEVNVDVQGLEIHYTPNNEDTSDADSADDGRWVELPVDPMTVNLLELQNGVDTLLASAELDPGTYQELRLLLGEENTVMVDSIVHDLKVPSGQETGFKIKFKADLNEGENLDVVVDFDAGRSVHQAGKSGKYILKPVLKAFVENGGEDDTGSLTGIVEPQEADPDIFAIMDEDTSSTSPDSTGNFLFRGLEAGTYQLSIEAGNDQYSDTTLTGIAIEEGEETDVGTIELSGSSGE